MRLVGLESMGERQIRKNLASSEVVIKWVGRQGFDVRLAAPAAAQALRALARSLRMLRIRFTLAPPAGFEPMGGRRK